MTSNFHANQYDKPFRRNMMAAWELGKYPPTFPKARQGCTKPITNDRGYLLPDIPKGKSSWDWFKGTWDKPCDHINSGEAVRKEKRRRVLAFYAIRVQPLYPRAKFPVRRF